MKSDNNDNNSKNKSTTEDMTIKMSYNPIYYKGYNEIEDLRVIKPEYLNVLPDDYDPKYFQHVWENRFKDIIEFAKTNNILKCDNPIDLIISDNSTLNVSIEYGNSGTIRIIIDNVLLSYITIFPMLIMQYKKSQDECNGDDESLLLKKINFVLNALCCNKETLPEKILLEYRDYCADNTCYAFLAASFTDALFTFIICHELGHICNNHNSVGTRLTKHEIEADHFACHLFFSIMRQRDYRTAKGYLEEFTLRAPLILFDMLELAKELNDIKNSIVLLKYNEYYARRIFLLTKYSFNSNEEASVIYNVMEDTLAELRALIGQVMY